MSDPLNRKAAEEPTRSSPPSGRGSSHGNAADLSGSGTLENNQLNGGGKEAVLDLSKAAEHKDDGEEEEDPYAHLPEHEAQILRDQVITPDIKAGAGMLYRYASRNDLIIIVVSAICAIASGAALPLMTVVFGNLQGTFQDYFTPGTDMNYDKFTDELARLVLYFVYLAIGEFVTSYIATVGFIYTGEHISAKIREHYLESCMKQNIGFFDKLGAGEVTTRITGDTNLIQEGISEKVGLTLQAVATFIAAFVIGFVSYWKLTLILLSTVFALLMVMGTGSRFIVKFSRQNIAAYAQGGSVAEEVISSIRNAVAFGTQDRLAKQYDTHLVEAEKHGFKLKATLGIMVAGMMTLVYLNYGLGFWMGSRYLVDQVISLSKMLTVMMSVMIGAFNLGNVAPNVQAFTTALGAAAKIYSTIDRKSPIDPSSDEGIRLENLKGDIRLEHVKHIYPSRPEVVVMDDVSLDIPAGKTTALVGASGSGKSTIIGLVERFYSPVAGTVYLDGVDISTLNLRWLRQQIALVSQEPTLFSTTIYENIRHGLIGSKWEDEDPEKQRERIYEAAKKANAHDFIMSLPEKYETNVGERGFLLSGGQKQRIAIARAIVSDPKILLLDEATSALDTKSEGVVQAALEAASEGRTTIVIAHRLSTIKDAHNIVVMAQGRIIEQGTHNELLEKRGAYYNLVTAQAIAAVNEMTAEEEEAIEKEQEAFLVRKFSGRSKSEAGISVPKDPDDDFATKLQRSQSTQSASSLVLQRRKAEPETKYSLWTLIKTIASFNKEEWKLMLVGLFFSAICGGGNPVQSVYFSKLIGALSVPVTPRTIPDIKSDASFWCLMYLMTAIVMFIAFAVQGVVFARCSERLIHRVRDRAFRAMLRQDVEYFDVEEHSAGALTSFLSTETTHVAGLSGSTLGTLIMVFTTLVAACTLALALGWKLALVCIATMPLVIASGFFRFWMLAHYQRRAKRAYTASASFASEAITAIRTVAALTREEDVIRQYKHSLDVQQKASLISVLKSSLLFAASQSLVFLVFALGFWYGGTLIAKGEYTMFQFFVVFMSVIFGAQAAGTVFSFAPDMGKAVEASRDLKALFDRKPTIDTWSDEGEKLESITGHIEFRDVHFRYPTRPEQPVLRGLNLTIQPGQYVALVGASGCGKSTTIALLERFYDPLAGGIYIDGKEISTLNVNSYRSFLALVSQEPTLYQGTIRENILLGSPNEVTEEQIKFACEEANIYDFIMSLPDGFDTIVGSKGTLLSGGQKQRIAIARALIRDPKILLLDEATSALDSESEHVVQAALDKAAKGRTTIAVAHRLSTIQKADVIYVFDQGRIVEQGTHAELMKKNGRYAELVNLQSLEKR
ncbi:mating factor A secretion protein STE6-like protein [Thermochaetoides thermophila DSM 1495]|uniref:Mating factor A secretion protein STE6-like protein n=1 Tax=Chaetomium thermophilum (strain DSM 1495 / CBS 144.50 / IMI 039719) TaxID=759272 RepID=G0S617_CHATD|nr:mating factor A secretion protein STE6-like protein [Thermochaetoides thermophila DSM 1495]EGS20733.1 mating factor A secretion protein STE6-like protein [Thermochaetoides thermophila DSM 1495]